MKSRMRFGEYHPAGQAKFTFESKVWLYDGPAAWYFVSLPEDLSAELSVLFADQKRGFGSLPVEVTLGNVVWTTSIFPDSKTRVYMLPLKAVVRKRVGVEAGDNVKLTIQIKV
jgi:hypothetical protein